jgi:hypothetical protein
MEQVPVPGRNPVNPVHPVIPLVSENIFCLNLRMVVHGRVSAVD